MLQRFRLETLTLPAWNYVREVSELYVSAICEQSSYEMSVSIYQTSTSQKTAIFIFIAVRNSNLTYSVFQQHNLYVTNNADLFK